MACAHGMCMACVHGMCMACAHGMCNPICDRIRRCIVRAWRARLQHERHGEGGEGGAVRRGRRGGGELDVARIDEADAHVQCSGRRQQSDEVRLGRPRARAPEETERRRVHHQPNQSRLPAPQLEQHAAFCLGWSVLCSAAADRQTYQGGNRSRTITDYVPFDP